LNLDFYGQKAGLSGDPVKVQSTHVAEAEKYPLGFGLPGGSEE